MFTLQRRYDEAIEDLERLYRLRDGDPYTAKPLARLYCEHGRVQDGLQLLKPLLSDQDFELLNLYLEMLIMQQQFADVVHTVRSFVSDVSAPQVPIDIRVNLGVVSASLHNWDAAEAAWKEVEAVCAA